MDRTLFKLEGWISCPRRAKLSAGRCATWYLAKNFTAPIYLPVKIDLFEDFPTCNVNLLLLFLLADMRWKSREAFVARASQRSISDWKLTSNLNVRALLDRKIKWNKNVYTLHNYIVSIFDSNQNVRLCYKQIFATRLDEKTAAC
jgi:hypothetical protein